MAEVNCTSRVGSQGTQYDRRANVTRQRSGVYTPVWRGREIEQCSHAFGTSEAGLSTLLFRWLSSINTDVTADIVDFGFYFEIRRR